MHVSGWLALSIDYPQGLKSAKPFEVAPFIVSGKERSRID